METGWELDKRTHFDEIVTNYDKIRPEYPNELFNDILKYSGRRKSIKVLEIGAGTGKATTPFLNAGYDITAVELGANMADFLSEKFEEYKNFKVINAAFEDVLLDECNYDLIYAATAFHWVDAEIGCPKVWRLLKSGGTFALFRYNMVPADGDELYEEIQANYENYYYNYYTTNIRPVKKSKEEYEQPAEILRGFRFKDLREYGFKNVSMKLYDAARTFGADEYIDYLDTCSDHIRLPKDNKAALYAEIKDAILRQGGYYTAYWIFQLYMGKKQ